jgi:hypothetical protein
MLRNNSPHAKTRGVNMLRYDQLLENKGVSIVQTIHLEGESMNKVIPNGSTCLFRKDNGGSRNGKIVLAELTNFKDAEFGSCYTVKKYQSTKSHDDDSWSHTSIVLKPLSVNDSYENIEIQEDELNEVKIIGIFECVLE